ncbi:glycosyltransferase family 4 protein [Pontibacter sp. MBLB2868]|uniref:glycosyltransferase family 4 protein n=1 Tax=Pontibacter sp. MBLB2868 TaxID=3451555 RepID=UPI003F75502D
MRILIIHNHYKEVGGEDTVFFAEAALLEEHGHEVQKLALSNKEVNTISEKLGAAFGVAYNWSSARRIEESIKTFQPDVVHVHNFFPLVSPAVFYICHTYKVPVVMTLHNYRLICPSALLHYDGELQMENVQKVFPLKPILKGVYRNSAFQTASVVLTTGIHKVIGTWRNKVDKYIALTPGAADLFKDSSLNLRQEQVAVKPNFTADPGLGEEERDDYFLYIGRLTPEKGIDTLLKAHQLQNFKLKIIGDGPLREQVQQYAAAHPDTVEYLGFQKREVAMSILKKAKALIFSSEWLETFGMTIVEAFATGTPVIAAKIGGAAHLVQHMYNGLHYTPQQPAQLQEQVQLLQQDNAIATELSHNARFTYEQAFTAEVNYRQLIKIYEDAVRQKKSPASPGLAVKAGLL